MRALLAAAVISLVAAGCGGPGPAAERSPDAAGSDRPATTGPPSPAVTAAPAPTTTTTTEPSVVEIAYRLDRRATDDATAGFEAEVERVLTDPRGWSRARYRLVRADDAPFLVVLAEPDEAHELCLPYDVNRRYSCQNGPVVVINADRWRYATPQWTGDLATYREMLVNHEVGHLLGMHHPEVQCPAVGQPAPIMAQQSTELDGCLPNPWPLPEEIERAARHDLPLAPPYDR